MPNVPVESLVGVEATFSPGDASPPHHHAASAVIYAYVLAGAIRSESGDAAPQIYHAGDNWSEPPGARHAVSEYASDAESARVLAVFVLERGESVFTRRDPVAERGDDCDATFRLCERGARGHESARRRQALCGELRPRPGPC